MRIVYAASEVAGLAKTGGLADVASALPQALVRRGHDLVVFLPFYRCVKTAAAGRLPITDTGIELHIPLGEDVVLGSIWQTAVPGTNIPLYLISQPGFFERDDPQQGLGLYQRTLPDGSKVDYPDNSSRFIFFARAVLDAIDLLDLHPDILHVNDWQTGLIPVYLREVYARHGQREVRERYRRIASVFTIHNIAYHGQFWHYDYPLTGLPWSLFNYRQLEFHGKINFLKAGIVFAHAVTTVSPTYAREIQTSTYGCGLQGVLLECRARLHGIVNGVDYNTWNPAHDHYLPCQYTPATVTEGKAVCKSFLQKRLRLAERPRTLLLGMVTRLVAQKGLDLIADMAGELLREEVQLVVLGEGEQRYHEMLQQLQRRHPNQVGVRFGFDEELAHQIEAGADVFLMPSLFEPCGLNQMYSLRYGTPPLVRATGGLADTVVDATPATLAAGTATGFSFSPPAASHLRATVDRARRMYRDHPDAWLQLQHTGMAQNWSWDRSAAEYERVYATALVSAGR